MTQAHARALSLSALTVLELTPPQMVQCAADAGYDFVGLRLLPATDHEVRHEIVGDTALKRETLAVLKGTGMRVLDVEIMRLKPDTDVTSYKPMLETAAELGARFALVAGNDPEEARTADRLAQLCDIAAPLGITPSLEPMPWTEVKNIAQGARIVAASGKRNTGLIIDPIHFDRAADSLDALRALPRDYFGYVQFCDAPAERPTDLDTLLFQARCERMIPGEGGLDLAGILRALPEHLPVSVEVPTQRWAEVTRAVDRARRLLNATRAVVEQAYTAAT
ncbi:sugar phosphate isomerase/epimerase [Paraburkholderia phymatum]|uniref:Xylose isomerase domain protein TIM barrel n=1 Tax=Paraburkholderia phymatum (strain DSM 17167 / CIP 108236 / LMG 21445 / STM815) TaxID=391038 RepID=B2JW34_PARP8|nr:sugar phosphate isomerase/epimerase [Paraburkholderia phymatum]ACC75161.1 Xylose isomerase domain protein TIM barrel [Paraburkholderia phymatum STM815]